MPFDFRSWITQGLSDLSDKELRKQYSQTLRNVRRRQANISRSEFAETELGQQAVEFKTSALKEVGKNRRDVENELLRLMDFQRRKQTSVSGLRSARSKAIQSLHSSGYTFVNKSNIEAFGKFMEKWRMGHPDAQGSPTPEEMKPYRKALSKLSPKKIEALFLEELENL